MENKMTKISIVTVCYNAEQTIRQTIESVLSQTYSLVEYIIVDGSSTDKTVGYIEAYKTEILNRGYEFVFISEKDNAIYDAMNKGIKASTGDWIHFRNSGDYFYDNRVLENIFSSPINPEAEIIHGDIRVFDCYGYCDKKPPILTTSYKKTMPVWHPAAFIKAELHKKMQFDIEFRLSGDYDFFYKCSELSIHFQYIPLVVALFNAGEGATITSREVGLKENLKVKGLDNSLIHLCNLKIIKWKNMVNKVMRNFFTSDFVIKRQIKNRQKAGWTITYK